MSDSPPSLTFDLRTLALSQLNAQLQAIADEENEIQIAGVGGQAALCVAIAQALKIVVTGNAGAISVCSTLEPIWMLMVMSELAADIR